jgi:hypothetical protein
LFQLVVNLHLDNGWKRVASDNWRTHYASRQSSWASTEGQLNTKEWGKLVWAVPPPSRTPLQAQSMNFLNRLCIFGILFDTVFSSVSSLSLLLCYMKVACVSLWVKLSDFIRLYILIVEIYICVHACTHK